MHKMYYTAKSEEWILSGLQAMFSTRTSAKLKVFGTLNSFPLSHLSFCLLSVKLTCQTAAFHTPMWYVSHAQLAKSSQTSLNCCSLIWSQKENLVWFLFAANYDVGCHQVICSLQRHWTWLRFAVFPLLNVVLKSSGPKKLWQRKHMLTATQ